jgi:hypothetical protein
MANKWEFPHTGKPSPAITAELIAVGQLCSQLRAYRARFWKTGQCKQQLLESLRLFLEETDGESEQTQP